MHILFAGGGTAGHINPALAVAGYILEKHPDTKISYIGTKNKLESKLVPAKGYDFYTVDVAGFQRKITVKNIFKNIGAVYKVVNSSVVARKLLKQLSPDIVVGTGGYVSGPVLREAVKLGIKTAIHEQNAFPGITNKMLCNKVDKVMLAMPEAEKRLGLTKSPVITGNPVREELLKINKEQARNILGIDNSKPVVLSFGGSLGARPINEAMAGLINNNLGKYQIFHATGKMGYENFKNMLNKAEETDDTIHIYEYINNMDVMLAAADLVICRAGAITLSELQVCGKPSILIPSPYVAENHQYFNALTLKQSGSAELIEEKDLSVSSLISKVDVILSDKSILNNMAENARKSAITNANERIYNVIMDLIKQ